jgi:hypothetical protein
LLSGTGDTKWYVPITYTTTKDFTDTTTKAWLTPTEDLTLKGVLKDASWFVLNNQQTGKYKINPKRLHFLFYFFTFKATTESLMTTLYGRKSRPFSTAKTSTTLMRSADPKLLTTFSTWQELARKHTPTF